MKDNKQLTVQFSDDIIYDALLGVRVFNGGVVVCHKIALKQNKAKCYLIWSGNRLYTHANTLDDKPLFQDRFGKKRDIHTGSLGSICTLECGNWNEMLVTLVAAWGL